MTVAVNVPTNYTHQTRAGGHAIMVAVDTMLKALGLTPVAFTGAYDPAGANTQLPDTSGGQSAWMAYDFSDTAQATHPITLSVALRYQRAGNSAGVSYGNHVYLPCFCVSEGVDSVGAPLGRYVQNIPRDAGGVMNTSYTDDCFRIRASVGDFGRYTGDSLTFFFGTNGMSFPGSTLYSSAISSAFELHIERRRSAVDGTIQSGFTGLVQPVRPAPSGSFAGYFPAGANAFLSSYVPSTPLTFARLDSSPGYLTVSGAMRSGGGLVLNDAGAPIVAPVFYRDADGKPTSMRGMFTIPVVAGATDGEILSLDFSGALKPYLYRTFPGSYFTAGSPAEYGHPPLAALFEWEV